jgi:hypothetical protein
LEVTRRRLRRKDLDLAILRLNRDIV